MLGGLEPMRPTGKVCDDVLEHDGAVLVNVVKDHRISGIPNLP
jgi:hypothetical protein